MIVLKATQDKVLAVLQSVAGIVERRHTLPILANVLIKKTGKSLQITTSDLEIQIRTTAELDGDTGNFTTTVGARKLIDILRTMPSDQTVSLESSQNKLILKGGKSRFTLQSLPAEDFPLVQESTALGPTFSVPQKTLKELLHQVSFSMAVHDIRYYLNGILFVAEGKLIGFVGGSAEDLEIARPLLEQMCKRVEHVGNHGAGSMMKLAINLPLLVYWHTFAEALSLIQPLGLDPKRVVDIFSETSGGPNLLKNRGAFIAQSLIDGKSDTVNVTLNTVIKDLHAMKAHAQTLERKLPLTELAMANFEASAQSGLGDADAAEHLVRWLKKS